MALTHQRAKGRLSLGFSAAGGRTRLDEVYQTDPCRALTPAPDPGEPVTAVLITTAGGLTGGDSLQLDIAAGVGSDLLCTPQAAEKIYRATAEETASIDVRLGAASGARLEWLPQEMILFDGARLRRSVTLDLAGDAICLAGDITVFGRIARGERLSEGLLFDRWQIRRDGRLVWTDSLRLDGAIGETLGHPAGFAGAVAQALILAQLPEVAAERDQLRDLIRENGMRAGATILDGLLLVRLLNDDAAALRREFALLWAVLRPALGREPVMPRHWRF